ncbi:MAG: hypothetical protein NTY53_13095, partial [Kiritimatiellaeota bacterium]|nr:hypothetical protein [Kiritimatiellota bacterium]
ATMPATRKPSSPRRRPLRRNHCADVLGRALSSKAWKYLHDFSQALEKLMEKLSNARKKHPFTVPILGNARQ